MSTTNPIPAAKFQLPQLPDVRSADKLVKQAIYARQEIVIKDDYAYNESWPVIQKHDAAIEKISQMFDPFVNGLHQLHKMAVQLRSTFLDPVMTSKRNWLAERVRYANEKEAAARKQRQLEADRLQKEQAKKLLADAKTMERAGDKESAAELRDQAQNVPAVSLPMAPAVPKQDGSVVKEKVCFEIVNPDEVPREFCDPTPARIRKYREAIGVSAAIPGVVFWTEKNEHSRAVR
jgi:hypothetical protein